MKTRFLIPAALLGAAALFTASLSHARADEDAFAKEVFETMIKVHDAQKAFRPVHAKGIVCKGMFEPTKEATSLSKAAHFQAAVPVIVRFSDGSPDPLIPDNSEGAGPRGMAIRFVLPGGEETDIVSMSHNGFVVGNVDDFLALQKTVVATDPSKPHPWPVEAFLGAHPLALKFVKESAAAPVSFATESFHGNDAFVFVNNDGTKQPGRYHIIPVDGQHDLSPDEAKAKSPDYLMDDLKKRLEKGTADYRVVVQLPNPGDSTIDPSIVWPDDRKTIEVGTIRLTAVDPDSDKAQKELAFDPTNLTDGIELSEDPFPELRSKVYAMSVARRQETAK